MLINIRISELQSNNRNSIALALFITILFSSLIFQVLPYSIAILNNFKTYLNDILYNISFNKSTWLFLGKEKIIKSNENLFFANSNS
jgi:NADH-ubiquinone oxidoreductase chain 6